MSGVSPLNSLVSTYRPQTDDKYNKGNKGGSMGGVVKPLLAILSVGLLISVAINWHQSTKTVVLYNENGDIKLQHDNVADELARTRDQLTILQDKVRQERRFRSDAEDELEAKILAHEISLGKLAQDLADNQASLKEKEDYIAEKKERSRHNKAMRKRLGLHRTNLMELHSQLEEHKSMLEEHKTMVEERDETIDQQDKKIQALQKEKKKLQKEKEANLKELEKVMAELEGNLKALEDHQSALEEKDRMMEALATEKTQLEEKHADMIKAMKKQEKKLKAMSNSNDDKEEKAELAKSLAEQREKLEITEAALKDHKKMLGDSEKQYVKLLKEQEDLRKQKDALERNWKTVNEQVKNLHSELSAKATSVSDLSKLVDSIATSAAAASEELLKGTRRALRESSS